MRHVRLSPKAGPLDIRTPRQRPISRAGLVTLSLAALLLALIASGSGSATAQEPPPIAGPGWFVSQGELVSPALARRQLDRRSVGDKRAVNAQEADITPLLQDQARGLEDDPRLIFDFVRNHTEFVPMFGSANGAEATMLAGRGNDWDQASLLIALLRAAGVTANYRSGDVTYPVDAVANLLGVNNDINRVLSALASSGIPATNVGGDQVELTRVWVEAVIDGQTVQLDPAMKAYRTIPGIDLGSVLSYNEAAFRTAAQAGATVSTGAVQNLNEVNVRAELTKHAMELVNHIRTNVPTATVESILGGREIVQTNLTTLPTSLPSATNIRNEQTFATIADSRRHTLRLQFQGIDHTFRSFEIAGKRVSIFFRSSGNDRIPELRLDGTLIATGQASPAVTIAPMQVTVDHPYPAQGGTLNDQSGPIFLRNDGAFVVMHDFGTASEGLFNARLRGFDPPATARQPDADETRPFWARPSGWWGCAGF